MNKFILGGLAGLVVGAALVSLTHPFSFTKTQTGARDLKIGIYLDPDATNGSCIVDFTDANVRRQRKDRVQWDALDGDYSVWMTPSPGNTSTPPGTPFQHGGNNVFVFNIKAGQHNNAGVPSISGDFYYEIYKGNYTSNPPANMMCADPGLHVKD